ncbi:unnamed protein product [Schistocephalus solidus]|uniref:Uncharacterized protein n=1 Tax=Schistocephalus solidus TaxID=70667 RepID=A0A183T1E9_SCHSO|nr:unnamed protein product [Schistocephalus solidus]
MGSGLIAGVGRVVPNSLLWLLEAEFYPATTSQATARISGLNQVRLFDVVGFFTRYVCTLPPALLPVLLPYSPPPTTSTSLVFSLSYSQPTLLQLHSPLLSFPSLALIFPPLSPSSLSLSLSILFPHFAPLLSLPSSFSPSLSPHPSLFPTVKKSQLEKVGAGYTFFWSGHPKVERCDADVTFATRNDVMGRLPCLSQGINDRMLSPRQPLRGDKFTAIISTYARPSMTSSDEAKKQMVRASTSPPGDFAEGG